MITDGLNPFNLLLFVGFVLGSGAAALLFIYSLLLKRIDAATLIAKLALAGVGVYGALFLAASVTSKDRVLAKYQEKHICEVDCHLAYAVLGVARTKTLGAGPEQRTAQGTFYVVSVRARFDSFTISRRRARDLPLSPNRRTVALVDAQGRRFGLSRAGQRAIPAAAGEVLPLTRVLLPGEAYTAQLVFDVPEDARDVRLVLEAAGPQALIIGHEKSLLHGKTTFRLEPRAATPG